jgi:hypothetical protein
MKAFIEGLSISARVFSLLLASKAGDAWLRGGFWESTAIIVGYAALVGFAWGPRRIGKGDL